MKGKYVLTYDLKILYCQDIDLNFVCKELNLKTLQFTLYSGDREYFQSGYELNPNEVNVIASDILTGKTGYALSNDKMKWLEKFENILKKDMSVLLNKKVAFTYFILKLQLLGFAESYSKDIMIKYYSSLEYKQKIAHPQVLLKNINRLIKEKIFWVPVNIENEENLEYDFLTSVIDAKQEMMYKFSFDQMFGDKYMKLCKDGIVRKLLTYNLSPSYLVRKKQTVSNLVPFILKEYKTIVTRLMKNIYYSKQMNVNTGFIEDTIKHMETTIRLYISLNYQ